MRTCLRNIWRRSTCSFVTFSELHPLNASCYTETGLMQFERDDFSRLRSLASLGDDRRVRTALLDSVDLLLQSILPGRGILQRCSDLRQHPLMSLLKNSSPWGPSMPPVADGGSQFVFHKQKP